MTLSNKFKKAALYSLTALALTGGGRAPAAFIHESNGPETSAAQSIDIQPAPLSRAHSHNDYHQRRPLFEALDNGFNSVEADVYLVNGQLLVGHSADELSPDRTLQSLYLKPLLERVRQNDGRVYPQSQQNVQLIIDLKTEGNTTYQAVETALQNYAQMLTSFSGNTTHPSAITVVISGNRPDKSLVEAQHVRYAAIDGTLADLGKGYPASYMPLVSDDWAGHFTWDGRGSMPAQERQRLVDMVSTAHANGQKIRFWNAPDNDPAVRTALWKELTAANVDYINTDHLSDLRAWLQKNDGVAAAQLKTVSDGRPGNKASFQLGKP